MNMTIFCLYYFKKKIKEIAKTKKYNSKLNHEVLNITTFKFLSFCN